MPSELGLATSRGVVFDLDGRIWNGSVVNPGARQLIAALGRIGRGVAFLTNNSRATCGDVHARLRAARIEAAADRVLTPLEILGEVIRARHGSSRVLVIGAPEMAAVVRAAGHEVLPPGGLSRGYRGGGGERLRSHLCPTHRGLPRGGRGRGLHHPQHRSAVAHRGRRVPAWMRRSGGGGGGGAGRQPEVVGKPEPPLFEIALARLGIAASEAVMVGDSVESDVRGGRAVGMRTVVYCPEGPASPEADLTVRSFAELDAVLLGR